MRELARRAGMVLTAGALSVLLVASAAFGAVSFDVATGTGFVGKGDVQLALSLNNSQLQAEAENIKFRARGSEVSEVSWECTNLNNEKIQERERTTTTTTEGVVSATARVRNQITGFNLNGYSAGSSSVSTTEGPPLNSCPAPASTWTLTTGAGAPEVLSSSRVLQVSNGGGWVTLQ